MSKKVGIVGGHGGVNLQLQVRGEIVASTR